MTVVTINGEAWAVGVHWIFSSHPDESRRFPLPPPKGAAAWVESGGAAGFVTAAASSDSGAVSLGAALRTVLPRSEPWVVLAWCDDGRTAVLAHLPSPLHFSPEAVCRTADEVRLLVEFCGGAGARIHATPPLAGDATAVIDMGSLPRTEEMRLATPAAPWFRARAAAGVCAALALAIFVTNASAQDGTTQLPLPPAATVDVIQPDPPPREEAAPPPPAPPPSPEESLDEAAEALIQMLATDDPAQAPPMAECAIDLLRSRLATAVEGDDVLVAIALENELLALCSERQKLVLEVLTTELALASMVAGETLQEAVPEAAAILPAAQPDPPAAATLDQIEVEAAPAVVEEQPVREPAPPASPGLSWVTVLGSAGNLRAALTDGTAVWWVREGDALAGGWQVTRVSAQPPGVTLSHAESGHHALPFHSSPAAGADEP